MKKSIRSIAAFTCVLSLALSACGAKSDETIVTGRKEQTAQAEPGDSEDASADDIIPVPDEVVENMDEAMSPEAAVLLEKYGDIMEAPEQEGYLLLADSRVLHMFPNNFWMYLKQDGVVRTDEAIEIALRLVNESDARIKTDFSYTRLDIGLNYAKTGASHLPELGDDAYEVRLEPHTSLDVTLRVAKYNSDDTDYSLEDVDAIFWERMRMMASWADYSEPNEFSAFGDIAICNLKEGLSDNTVSTRLPYDAYYEDYAGEKDASEGKWYRMLAEGTLPEEVESEEEIEERFNSPHEIGNSTIGRIHVPYGYQVDDGVHWIRVVYEGNAVMIREIALSKLSTNPVFKPSAHAIAANAFDAYFEDDYIEIDSVTDFEIQGFQAAQTRGFYHENGVDRERVIWTVIDDKDVVHLAYFDGAKDEVERLLELGLETYKLH